jgi:hypothetical protein
MSRTDPELVWLIDPKRSAFGYWFVYGAGILQVFGAMALSWYGSSLVEWAFAAILLCSALLFLAVAKILGARKGGVALEPGRDSVCVFGRDAGDGLRFPLSEVTGILVRRRMESWAKLPEPVLVSSVELAVGEGLSVLLFEASTLDQAQEAALAVRQVLKKPILQIEGTPAASDRSGGRGTPMAALRSRKEGDATILEFGTGMRWAFSAAAALLTLFCVLTAVLLLAGLRTTGVIGFLFGPFAGMFGLVLLALWLFKWLGSERLRIRPGSIEQSFVFLGRAWGTQRLEWGPDGGIQARIRSRAALGLSLELLSGGKALAVATGSTRGCSCPPSVLPTLARQVLAATTDVKQ